MTSFRCGETLPGMSIEELTAAVASLNQAIADGVRSVTIGAETTTYNTTQSLITARDDMERRLLRAQDVAASRRPNRQTRLYYAGRGY